MRFHVPNNQRHTRKLPVAHGMQGCAALVAASNRVLYCSQPKGHEGPHGYSEPVAAQPRSEPS